MQSAFNPFDCESGKFNLSYAAISIGKRSAGSGFQLVQYYVKLKVSVALDGFVERCTWKT